MDLEISLSALILLAVTKLKDINKMKIIILLAILIISANTTLASKKLQPLTTVDRVDLNRYAGLWYQFAYFPNSFQPKNSGLTTAEYTLHPKGHITVKNTAYKDFEGSKVKSDIKGKAFVADKSTNSRLKVQFFWPFKADYWIILLDENDYKWAVVSDPSRKYLWILTRSPYLDRDLYRLLLAQIEAKNIDTGKIEITGKFE
jgi:apolipoprotein D and lipocalin family protein